MVNDLFIYVAIFVPLIPLIVGMRGASGLKREFKLLIIYVTVSFLNDILCLVLAKNGIPNLLFINLFGLFQGSIIILLFKSIDTKFYKHLDLALPLYILAYCSIAFLYEGISKFDGIAMTVQALLMILLSLSFFYKVYVNETVDALEDYPLFWIVIGILVYFSGALYTFILGGDILSGSTERFYHSWILHNVSAILKNILFAIGLWRAVKK